MEDSGPNAGRTLLNQAQKEAPSSESSRSADDRTRYPHKFSDVDAALDAARGQYPTDYIVAIGGNMREASSYAHDGPTIRAIARLREFGAHEGDTLVIWLRGKQPAAQQAA
jgi:hypothetical protein